MATLIVYFILGWEFQVYPSSKNSDINYLSQDMKTMAEKKNQVLIVSLEMPLFKNII